MNPKNRGVFEGLEDLSVRKAVIEDAAALHRLYHQLDRHHADLLPEVFRPLGRDPRSEAFIGDVLDDPRAAFFVAVLDGEVVGFLEIRISGPPDFPVFRKRDFAYIENTAVDASLRGRGIGEALFDAALEWAASHGVDRIQTSVWNENTGAVRFYERRGFRPVTLRLERVIDPPDLGGGSVEKE